MLEVALFLPNTDHLQQVDDYVRGCTISTKYWPPSTWWGLCQSLYYFYQILTASNMVNIMSEFVLLLLHHASKLWSEVCTDLHLQQLWWSTNFWPNIWHLRLLCRSTSTKYWPPPTIMVKIVCQSLYFFYQILTASNKVRYSVVCTEYQTWQPLQLGEVYVSSLVLLLPQYWGCQYVVEVCTFWP